MSGYFGIGIQNSKTIENVGTLWRSANISGASFIFTVGKRYQRQCSDTLKTPRSIPLYEYKDFDELAIPYDCQLIGIELTDQSISLPEFKHPKRAIYILGAEDSGLSKAVLEKCVSVVQVPSAKPFSLNVASTGTVVLYDRYVKENET